MWKKIEKIFGIKIIKAQINLIINKVILTLMIWSIKIIRKMMKKMMNWIHNLINKFKIKVEKILEQMEKIIV